jgi:hypothetical protein
MKSAAHGQDLTAAGWTRPLPSFISAAPLIRLLSPAGDLVGLARPSDAAGVLHPFVVLM